MRVIIFEISFVVTAFEVRRKYSNFNEQLTANNKPSKKRKF